MKIGILGAGQIASTMARTIGAMPDMEAYAIASRSRQRADAFAGQYGFQKAFGSYAELADDPEVDLVYIATPHSHHYEQIRLCLERGRNVLCEKAFTQNAKQAAEVLEIAKARGLLLAEAIWTRYLPMRRTLEDILKSGVIGTPTSLYATLSYAISDKQRITDPALAGGALLDIGVYGINFALMAFGNDIQEVRSSAVLTERGVDAAVCATLVYHDGKMAILHSDTRAADNREGAIYGEKGYIIFKNINNCEEIEVYNAGHALLAKYAAPPQITGFEYQVRACAKAIKDGAFQCAEMPHSEILFVMELMDQIRSQIGVVYPNEKQTSGLHLYDRNSLP